MTRHERVRRRLHRLHELGIVKESYVYRPGTGLRWVFTPYGHGERSFSTNEVEVFLLGAEAAIEKLKSD